MPGSMSTALLWRPYRAVDKETFHVSDEIVYMTADEEDNYIVGQAAEPLDENGCLINARITARHRDEIVEVDKERAPTSSWRRRRIPR